MFVEQRAKLGGLPAAATVNLAEEGAKALVFGEQARARHLGAVAARTPDESGEEEGPVVAGLPVVAAVGPVVPLRRVATTATKTMTPTTRKIPTAATAPTHERPSP